LDFVGFITALLFFLLPIQFIINATLSAPKFASILAIVEWGRMGTTREQLITNLLSGRTRSVWKGNNRNKAIGWWEKIWYCTGNWKREGKGKHIDEDILKAYLLADADWIASATVFSFLLSFLLLIAFQSALLKAKSLPFQQFFFGKGIF
jgi:hypothetical protein